MPADRVIDSGRMLPRIALEPKDYGIMCAMPQGEISPSLVLPHAVLGFVA